ncbi:MAG: DUF401 family protein [Thermotogae bacterium]|nr:DUF401 family protein [Thermotogota bacterium]MCP5465077.1 DUF401 family protein [Thermotogota bacterium]
MAILSILSGFAAMILIIKITKKIHFGILAAIFATAFISANFPPLFQSFIYTFKYVKFYEIIVTIYGIYLISDTMKVSGNSKIFSESIKNLFSARQAVALMPMALGLLPMPGGAMFTAPMIKEISDENGIKNIDSASMNYWFRHSMEFFWILYPALIFESALSGIKILTLLFIQLPIGIFSIVSAWIFFRTGKIKINHSKKDWKNLLISVLPIIFIMIGVISSIPGWIVVLTVAFIYSLYYKNYKGILKINKNVMILIFFVFWYKNLIEISGLSDSFVGEMQNAGMSPWIIIVLSPLIIGMITGITQAAFAVTMPIAMSFVNIPVDVTAITVYYFSVIGVLLSPVHLCLVLTSEYFGVKISSMLKKLTIPFLFSFLGYIIMSIVIRI